MTNADVGPIPLHLSTTRAGESTIVLAVAGEIDMDTVGDLGAAMSTILDQPAVRRLVLDFAQVTFLDCSGIAALVAAHRIGRDRHTSLHLVNCQRMPRQVLEITGVDKILLGPDRDAGPPL